LSITINLEIGSSVLSLASSASEATATHRTLAAKHAASIVESCAEAIFYVSTDGTVLMVNAAAAVMFGCSPIDAIGRPLNSFRSPSQWATQRQALARVLTGEVVRLEMVGSRDGNDEFRTLSTLSPVKNTDGEVVGVSAIVRYLSPFEETRNDLAEMPRAVPEDSPDRARRLRQLATGVRTDVADAVVIVDTKFRIQSLNYGAERMYGWTETEAIGKPMNDIIPWLGSEADFQAAERRLLHEGRWHGRAIQGRRDGGVVHVLASTTLLRDDSGQPSGAISVNRRISEDSINPADPSVNEALLHELQCGLDRDEFIVHYQPIVHLDDGNPIGVEALVRWNHPTRGLLLPDQFIEAAERSGLICELGEVVLKQACVQAQCWRAAGLELYLSVNVSAQQLAGGRLPARLVEIMTLTDMRPADLWIEITETALVEDLEEARAGLRQIDELGVHISIDDFGTGWASLTYLREFPVRALKIDLVFVHGLGTSSCDLAIVKSIISLGSELGLDVVAEGIETLDQRAMLYQLGCEKGQGYLFGGPAPAEELFLIRNIDSNSVCE
jgi:PAS domain S-box-containing protein